MVRRTFWSLIMAALAVAIVSCSNESPISVSEQSNTAVAGVNDDFPYNIMKQAVCHDGAGKSNVFALCEDGKVYYKYQTRSSLDPNTWRTPVSNLSKPSGVTLNPSLVAARNSDGKAWVFSIANSGSRRIWYRRQISPGSYHFTSWANLPVSGGYGQLGIATGSSNELVLLFKNNGGYLYAGYFSTSGLSTYGKIAYQAIPDNFTVAKNNDGRLEVFVPYSREVKHIWQNSPGTWTWTHYWQKLGASTPSNIDLSADLACVRDAYGLLEIFINTTNRKMYSCRQAPSISGGWEMGWTYIGGNCYKRMAAGMRGDAVTNLIFAKDGGDDGMFVNYYYKLPGASSWTNAGTIGRMFTICLYKKTISANISLVDYWDTYNIPGESAPGKMRAFFPNNRLEPGALDVSEAYCYEDGHDPDGWSNIYNILGAPY
ncbi:MAG: hypothetical protein JXB48_23675 [Candidatus Latescibacteria bacterium]|nr:hypothetical protein [Candidatus Latescibacterota bacterium]